MSGSLCHPDALGSVACSGWGTMPPELLGDLVDLLDFGVLLLEGDGRVRGASRPARDMLAAGTAVHLDDGRIALHGAQAQRRLLHALGDAALGTPGLLWLQGGAPPATLGLAPWRQSHDGTHLLIGTLRAGERDGSPALRAYAHTHRLTTGETDVLRMLTLGAGLPQIAARRGSSENTVRSQVRTLLDKTGTGSMRELIVEVLHLAPVPERHAPIAGIELRDALRSGRPVARCASPGRGAQPEAERDVGTHAGPASTGAGSIDPSVAVHGGARVVVRRAPNASDRAAVAALCASRFAWPPTA